MKTPSTPHPFSPYCLGLDIASQTFTARLLHAGRAKGNIVEFPNSGSGYKQLEQWIKAQGAPVDQTHVVMEATGVYWEECALHMHTRGYRVNVVNPAQVKAFATMTLRRSKTDRTDADLIARFAATIPLCAWEPPSLEMEALQIIIRHREALIAMLTEEKNRLHALERRPATPSKILKTVKKHIAFLQSQVKELDDSFKKNLRENEQWQECYRLLQSIPGIGEVLAATLLTETNALGSFLEARQLIAHAGIAPQQHESGTSVKKPASISKVGNARLRRAAYVAALSASRCAGPLKTFYTRLRAKGKPPKVALIALARKILALAFVVVRTGRPFDPDYQAIKA